MVLLHTPVCDFNLSAVDFNLPGVDGWDWSLQQCKGENGLLVMFLCNHCPYVKSILAKIVRDTDELKTLGINCVAIMANDQADYPDDSFENMARLAQDKNFSFPYLLDETQQVAKNYGAVCTPDFFGYNAQLKLQYRGRLDDSGSQHDRPDASRDLFLAMQEVASTGRGPQQQIASMGCSIKWKKGV